MPLQFVAFKGQYLGELFHAEPALAEFVSKPVSSFKVLELYRGYDQLSILINTETMGLGQVTAAKIVWHRLKLAYFAKIRLIILFHFIKLRGFYHQPVKSTL